MRTIGLVALALIGTCDMAFGQQGDGNAIARNAAFVADDPQRLKDGRAEAAMRAARENVLAFERLRAADAIPPLAVARTDQLRLLPPGTPSQPRRAVMPRMSDTPMRPRRGRRG
ncbi:hypothetical protein [Salinarimonas soli]|uniref:Uncharacterized protein n=1 Tax=Salinarimonas soli TaxID=1638099 RepID=A0A5B2VIG4_9HYPH|nr:hypothetical protein [Salinarimonas soli]KAA2238142.1 hypothetical protein F0L46_06620 [Salinarimonas soli]